MLWYQEFIDKKVPRLASSARLELGSPKKGSRLANLQIQWNNSGAQEHGNTYACAIVPILVDDVEGEPTGMHCNRLLTKSSEDLVAVDPYAKPAQEENPGRGRRHWDVKKTGQHKHKR